MRFLKLLGRSLIAAVLLSAGTHAASLPEPVSEALKRAHIPQSAVGIVVQEVDAVTPVLSLNAAQPLNPASTMKLLTTFAALETLGPAYRWKTEAYLDGKLENGVLDGNLVFKGYGDPKLTVEQFWMWLRELRQRGLRDIRGDIVLDDSAFHVVNPSPADFDNDPTRAYNVGTDALLLNFNAIHLHLVPTGHATIALLDPDLSGYTVQNDIVASTRLGCRNNDGYRASLDGHTIRLEGRIPANCGELDSYFSLLPHDEYFFAVFSALWKELGGNIQGRVRSGIVPAGQTPYSKYQSPELAEVIRDINKFSNNIMARQVFLALGTVEAGSPIVQDADNSGSSQVQAAALQFHDEANVVAAQQGGDRVADLSAGSAVQLDVRPPATLENSLGAIQRWLKSRQLQFPELVLENGAGLSRKERISAQHLAELLQHATHSPYYAELKASLPILGMDGTVQKRFRDSDLAGHAHLKTGTLDDVKSMAGYVDARDGRKWIVVFVINHPNAARGQAAQDALVEWAETGSCCQSEKPAF